MTDLVQPAIGLPLPPVPLRMGGAHFREDADFVAAAIRDVALLQRHAGLTRESRLLDWGCGAGRLAVGVRQSLGHVRDYHGVDMQPELLEWAREHLTDEHTRFSLVDQRNERYNPEGAATFTIPAEPGSVDVLYAYSVFSHMLEPDVRGYAASIAEILAPAGPGADDRVRRERRAGLGGEPRPTTASCPGRGGCTASASTAASSRSCSWDAGLAVDEFVYGRETDGQSLYSLRPRASF